MTLPPPPDPQWLAALAGAEVRNGAVTVVHGGDARSFSLFCIEGFPCSGMDWVGRLLSLHPAIAVGDTPRRLGPLGGGRSAVDMQEHARARDVALRASLAAAGAKPGATHIGLLAVSGDFQAFDPRIRVFRDGRDVVVAWTLRQLRETGEAMKRFLGKPPKDRYGMVNRMPELHRRFAADPADILVRNPGLLLADYEWIRYASHLWDDDVSGYFGTIGAICDGKISGAIPLELYYEEARARPLDALNAVAESLGLAALPSLVESIVASEPDPLLQAEWEVGQWKRFFTPRATKLFKIDANDALQSVTKNYDRDFDEWQGECLPCPD